MKEITLGEIIGDSNGTGEKDTTMTDLKIEAGKCYRTRDGNQGYPVFRDEDGRWHGTVIWHAGGGKAVSYNCIWDDGGCVPSRGEPCDDFDLISEWKEPRKGEVWVAAFDDGLSERDGAVKFVTFRTEAEAKAAWFCGEKAFAIKGVTLTEGQGLTGEGSE